MIYEKPRFLPGGDRYMLIEFGNEMNLELNFMAQGLAGAIEKQPDEGRDRDGALLRLDARPLRSRCDQLQGPDQGDDVADRLARPVRRYRARQPPVLFPDLLSRSLDQGGGRRLLRQDHEEEVGPRVRRRGSTASPDVQQFVRVHSGTEYWVASLGFWPGLPFMMALDPRCVLTAPKYNPPRTWTPQGTVGMGGASTAIYPVATPGGYQIFARIPVPIWDTEKRFPQFEKSICLFQPGDRVKFVPVSPRGVRARRGPGQGRHLCLQRGRVPALLGAQLQDLDRRRSTRASGSRRTAPCSK